MGARRSPRTPATLAAVVGAVLTAVALAGCDGGSEVSGEPADWARTVCGEEAPLEEIGGEVSCTVDAGGTQHELTASVEDDDDTGNPDSFYSGEGRVAVWATARVADGYGVLRLVGGPTGVDTALLDPLVDEGFELDE